MYKKRDFQKLVSTLEEKRKREGKRKSMREKFLF